MTTTELNELDEAPIKNKLYWPRKRKSIDLSGRVSDYSNSPSIKIPLELVLGLVFSGSVIGAIEGFNYSEHHPYLYSIGGYFIGGVLGAISIAIGNSIFQDIKSMTSNYRTNK